MPYETLRYERRGHVGTLTLARPGKRNAQNPRMLRELVRIGEELRADETLRCLVVAGEGPSFSAGLDLREGMAEMIGGWADRPPEHDRFLALGMAVATSFEWIPRLHCPSIAAVQGHAYGAGLQLALACDFRVFAEGARAGLTETRFGLLPDMGATFRLPLLVGEARARELILLGEIIDHHEAQRIGLANQVVAADELHAAAQRLADRLAAQPPLAVSGARRAMDAVRRRDGEASLRIAVEQQAGCITSEDFKEARQAMAEGRPPEWRGR
ncbi:enoyl-CoA hydratase/isomerase family protein [Actinomadura physcomitrii]|uniref:enoyl-CoA hydratase/isomerase family protein n=1 Tax=Actinomadura physcomitrii TaxID=2650748 RepID=UPI00136AC107|nr:enoyl-CoA hydratase/isomerase family protein [Actinomadura physcomitrii]